MKADKPLEGLALLRAPPPPGGLGADLSAGLGGGQWGAPPTANPYGNGSKTPAWPGQKTPNPYARTPYGDAGGKTPGWGVQSGSKTPGWGAGAAAAAGAKTPGWGASGSKTPSWNAGSSWNAGGAPKTPAWNAGAQTPAWQSSARTPNPYHEPGPPEPPSWGASGSESPVWAASWGDAASAVSCKNLLLSPK